MRNMMWTLVGLALILTAAAVSAREPEPRRLVHRTEVSPPQPIDPKDLPTQPASSPGPFFVLHADETAWAATRDLIETTDGTEAVALESDELVRWDLPWVERLWGQAPKAVATVPVGFGLDVNLVSVAGDELTDAAERHGARAVVLLSANVANQALRQAAAGGVSPLTVAAPGAAAGVARSAYVPESAALLRTGHMRLCGQPDPTALVRAMRRHAAERARLHSAIKDLREGGVPVLELFLDAMDHDAASAAQLLGHFLGFAPTAPSQDDAGTPLDGFELPIAALEDCADSLQAARLWLAVQDDADVPALIAAIDPLLGRLERYRAHHHH